MDSNWYKYQHNVKEESSIKQQSLRKRKEELKNENDARRNSKGSMDRARRHSVDQLRALVRGSALGFYSQSFRFEGWREAHNIGLNRTGKSCRLRWVNYLHPGLKRGKMTPQEEKLVLELHEKWGNRWSRIARKLPGRTDNEIKNYWRTHMRKKAQQKKKNISPSSSSSSLTSYSESNITTTVESTPFPEPEGATFYDTGGRPESSGLVTVKTCGIETAIQGGEKGYTMDDIWKDIETNIEPFSDEFRDQGCSFSCPSMASPVWDYCSDTLWDSDFLTG